MTEEQLLLLLYIIAIFGILILFLWLYIFLPAKMARKRGRSALGWVLLFWIITPLWGIIILLVLGDSKQKIREDIIEELNNRKQ